LAVVDQEQKIQLELRLLLEQLILVVVVAPDNQVVRLHQERLVDPAS
jgi:hypothetical protein